jgi:hypothetical protein
METIYEDDYIKISIEPSEKIISDVWTKETQNMSAKKFKEILLIIKEIAEENKLKYILSDARQFLFLITPELQEWTIGNITIPLVQEVNFAKQSFIMPIEFIANLSIEQFTEESNINGIQTKYFADMAEAREWLLNG